MTLISESTITFTTLLVGLLTTGVLVLLPSTWQVDGRALRYWVIGNLLLSLDRAYNLLVLTAFGERWPPSVLAVAAACVVGGAAMHVLAVRALLQPERARRDVRLPAALGLVVVVLGIWLDDRLAVRLLVMTGTLPCTVLIGMTCLPHARQLRGALVMAAAMAFFLAMLILGIRELGAQLIGDRAQPLPTTPTAILALDLVLSVVVNLAFLLILIEQLHRRVERLSVTDPLTGVLNRRGFLQAANLQLLHADRMRYPHRAASVLLLDLDHFKRINDRLGHPMGDAVLRGAAQRVVETVRQSDVVARWGGEEFVVLLPGTRLGDARDVAERIRQAIAGTPLAEQAPIVTVSIGAAALEDALAVDQLPALIADADRRLYLAKRQRNCVVVQD